MKGAKDTEKSFGGFTDRRRGDAGKVRVARRLRWETTMTLNWIA